MNINYIVNDINLSDDVKDIYCKIDKKVSEISNKKLNYFKFGTIEKQNCKTDYELLDKLIKYKDILYKKINNYSCLSNYSIDSIIGNINDYLQHGSIRELRDYSNIKKSINKNIDSLVNYIMVNYNFNGTQTNNTYNSYNSVTQRIDDTWDKIEW